MMQTDLYQRAKEIFLRICDAPAGERAGMLAESCDGDAALRAEVEGLLSHDEGDDALADSGAMAPGARVGQYTIVRQIGAGAMGLVYEATQQRPQRTVALKVVRSGAASASLRRRLEHEAAALARVQHPGIAAVYETGIDGASGAPFFAMELVRGEPLTAGAARLGLDLEARIELLAAICDAVQHAHQRGVIHRDLKPSNILVDESGRARVLDFGIARITAPDGAATLQTLPGQVIGTLAYMSPEQAAGDPEAIDVRADIYALGAIAYELLAGRPPLDVAAKSIPEALRLIQQVEPPKLGALDRRLRGDLEIIVAAALEKDPQRRYQSAASLAGDLRRALRDEPIVARAPTTFYQLRKFARRQRGLVAATGAIAATLVLAAIVSVVFAVRADAQRARAEAAQGRAEARFDQVRALANVFLFDMHDMIAPLAGSIEARRRLVETGLTYLDSLAAEAQDDPHLLEELAEAYFRIGDIQGNPRRANLGDVEAALASYDQSVELRRRAAQLDPAADRQVKLMLTHIAIGETLTSSERPGDALARFEAARSGLERERTRRPEDVDVLDTLSLAEGRTGSALLDMGRLEEALRHFEACLALAERVAELEPTDAMRRRVTIALNEVGRALGRMGRDDESLPYYERSMAIRAAAAAAAPQDTRAQRDLALAHHRLSDVHRAAGNYEAALSEARSAHAILSDIEATSPTEARARYDLAVAEHKIAGILETDRPAEALEHHRAARQIMVALSAENPDNLFYATGALLPQERVAHSLRLLHRYEDAQAEYQMAIDMAERIHASSTSDVRPWTALASAQRGIGLSLLAQGEAAEDDAAAAALRARAAEWLSACLATLAQMEALDMTPTRDDLTREQLEALLAECRQEARGSGTAAAPTARAPR
ncbi:MAG: protein kinase [Phycisphaerales bacterium JB039]